MRRISPKLLSLMMSERADDFGDYGTDGALENLEARPRLLWVYKAFYLGREQADITGRDL